ncbi:TIGR03862 family flavoprotein [Gymnodinialimonas ceratoperidinii]|uniref:TIGR03862 family flavoprotein n=1 Tax=Gymnodinialimonas ceratoperidinii TaxID=2856823 RepID=A0A8F6YCX9_9RHOB|nr:TIGR03862 family flavoprotein [Gymnodinialimonas ceratoperidinii]QXT39820.1 TIGR03862 family flavoprotein [Gymnodinialimonas ceratoperidinii]
MQDITVDALVIGSGPAGLMAAETLVKEGRKVTIAEAKPSAGRKFLMAGKSGLNLTKDEKLEAFARAYGAASDWLYPMIAQLDPVEVMAFAENLGQPIFTGTTGRVFPKAMKASPLLRAWLQRLDAEMRLRWRWTGFDGDALTFDTPEGPQTITPAVTVLALGGASWSRLGSDGAWAEILSAKGVTLAPFKPANMGLKVAWSEHMEPHLGAPLKNIALQAGDTRQRGEAVISHRGLEGGGIYAVSSAVREGAELTFDLLPDRPVEGLASRLRKRPRKQTLTKALTGLGLDALKRALLQEFARPLPEDPMALAQLIKALPVKHDSPRPMDEAISTAGGVPRAAVTKGLMLEAIPGVFVAGEMLDWEAPTGGYLINGCLATGRWAGLHAARYHADR